MPVFPALVVTFLDTPKTNFNKIFQNLSHFGSLIPLI